MLQIRKDGNGHPFIQWQMSPGNFRRAWIRYGKGEKDYAGTGRYLSVVRTETLESGPGGNATDFPIFSKLSDEQILEAFVASVNAIAGIDLSGQK